MCAKCTRLRPDSLSLSERDEANSLRSMVGQPERGLTHDGTRRRRAKFPDRSLRELQGLGLAAVAAFLSLDKGGAA
jgi:hypothetical protein